MTRMGRICLLPGLGAGMQARRLKSPPTVFFRSRPCFCVGATGATAQSHGAGEVTRPAAANSADGSVARLNALPAMEI